MLRITTLLSIFTIILGLMSCDGGVVDPIDGTGDNSDPVTMVAELELVQLNGNLAKTSTVDIQFGEIAATQSLHYIITNNGSVDAFNVQLSAEYLSILPTTVGVIAANQLSGLQTNPVINITIEHVIPASGVGSLLPFELGAFVDSVFLSYQYENMNNDTVDVTKSYAVSATRMGVDIQILVNGNNVMDILDGLSSNGSGIGMEFDYLWEENSNIDFDLVQILNHGNAPTHLNIFSSDVADVRFDDPLYTSPLLPNDTIDVSDYVVFQSENYKWLGPVTLGPTAYIQNFYSGLDTDGLIAFILSDGGY